MNDGISRPPPLSTGSVVLDNQQVYNLLMRAINDQVTKDGQKRMENLRNWLIGISTIAVIILTTGGTITVKYYVKNAVNDTVASEVEKTLPRIVNDTVASEVEKTGNALRFQSEVAALNFRILNLDLSDGFARVEADNIISKISRLVSSGGEEALSDLTFALDTAVKNFAAADRLDLVERLVDIGPEDWSHSSVILTPIMVQSLGFKLLGDAGAPDSWKEMTGSRNETYENYRTYVSRAESVGYPELYLLYEMLLGHIEKQPKETINNLIDDADDLDEGDADHFVTLMAALATEKVVVESTAESRRTADRVAEFLCEYGDQGALLSVVSSLALDLNKCTASGT